MYLRDVHFSNISGYISFVLQNDHFETTDKWDQGCSHAEAQSIVKASVCNFLKTIDHHEESHVEQCNVFIGLRSGRSTGSNAAPSRPLQSPAPEPSSDGTRGLRSGRNIDTSPPDPETEFSAQYVPPDTRMAPAVLTTVPPLRRWVVHQTKHQNISEDDKKHIQRDVPGYPPGLKNKLPS